MKYLKNVSALLFFSIFGITKSLAQVSDVWVADQGDGTYINPILHADYSDPDVVRVGDDFYMTASSFNVIPGLPILHSKDLVNWKLIGHALQSLEPTEVFDKPQHGNGVWAPSIRYHKGEFYIYWGDPDFGIFMVKSKDPKGPWSKAHLVEAGLGLIDPCPLWDEDGKGYLSNAYAGSRAGIKSVLVVKPMNESGTEVTGPGAIVFDGHENHPTVEGTKFYKRNGFYYIFAPAGGVSTGWQLILRSKSPYGPYEEHISLAQGNTEINGPHQGGWVELENGENWFIHFQDKNAYGRILHLQPMTWKEDWPTMGESINGSMTGQPVLKHKKPNVGKNYTIVTPPDSDEFDNQELGKQWQWHANPKAIWAFLNPSKSKMRLYTFLLPDGAKSLWEAPNLLLQKFPAEEFITTSKISFHPNEKLVGEKTGLIIMGMSYAYIGLESKEDGVYLKYVTCINAEKGGLEKEVILKKVNSTSIHFQVKISKGGICQFSYSEDGTNYSPISDSFVADPGKWIGAKVGLFATRTSKTNDSGFVDVDWFRFSKINN